MSADNAASLVALLQRIRAGDASAREAVIEHACEQLRRLTRKMLRGYQRLRRWEETDDVFQGAALRLHRSLCEVSPQTPEHFFALAATQIRRTLLDLARHHFGPEGGAAHHHTDPGHGDRDEHVVQSADGSHEPRTVQQWTEFHERVEALPEREREVFNLLWYQGLSQGEAAALLGVDVRTIKRRWQSARLLLHEAMEGQSPGG